MSVANEVAENCGIKHSVLVINLNCGYSSWFDLESDLFIIIFGFSALEGEVLDFYFVSLRLVSGIFSLP